MALEEHKSKKKFVILGLVILLLLAVGAYGLSKLVHKKIPATTLNESPNKPEEVDPIKAGYVWQGGPDDPKKIIISSISVDSYIQNVDKDSSGQIVAPGNIYIAGWYVQSAKLGKKGLSIIDGHLNGYKHDGIFINLDKLKPGDGIKIEMGDGTKFNYKVLRVDTVDESKAEAYLFSQSPKVVKQLNLITCGGDYDKKSQLYNKRVIVSAEQID